MSCCNFVLIGLWISGNVFSHSVSGDIISVEPKTETVTEGKTLTINCTKSANATNVASLNFTWRKFGESTVLENSSQLTFVNIKRSDSGQYSCTATNGTANWSDVATITVFFSPQIRSTTRNLTVNESSETNLFCNASGNPSPTIQWRLPNGSSVERANNKYLIFENTSKSQHGRYSCKARNRVGNSSSTVMYLNVQYKPEMNKTGRVVSSWLYHNSILTCQADGNPSPKITWSKDRKELLNGSISGSIHIVPKYNKDFGSYTCTARNALGMDEFHVDVVRTAFPPAPPEILNKDKQLSNRSFTLRWTTPADKGRPILRYLVLYRELYNNAEFNQKNASTNHSDFTLNWAMSYEFAVVAENDQGQSNKSKVEKFSVMPEPTKSTAKPRGSTTVTFEPTERTTKATEFTASDSEDALPKEYIFGASAGGGVLFLVIIVTVVCCIRKSRNTDPQTQILPEWSELQFYPSTKTSPKIASANTYNAVPHNRVPSGNNSGQKKSINAPLKSANLAIYTNLSCLEDEVSDWEFPREKLNIEKYVGKGAFCVVAKALAEGLGTVAVKIPKDNAPEANKKDLLAEYELMKELEPHPNVIRLIGAVTQSDPVMVMFEYIPYGDLLGFLRRSRGLNDNYYKDPDVKPSSSLTSEQLLKFAREIADGMAFLAANKIIHRDLAARNVLVGEEETCKITDFGMARDVQEDDIYRKRNKGRLPAKWTAVESLLYGYCTTQSDVWSYGVVLYEIFTIGGCPYPNIQAHRIPYMLKDSYRMPKPDHLDDEIYALMCECWRNEPDRRPTFESISRTIKRLERCHKEIIYMNVYDEQLYGNVEGWD